MLTSERANCQFVGDPFLGNVYGPSRRGDDEETVPIGRGIIFAGG